MALCVTMCSAQAAVNSPVVRGTTRAERRLRGEGITKVFESEPDHPMWRAPNGDVMTAPAGLHPLRDQLEGPPQTLMSLEDR